MNTVISQENETWRCVRGAVVARLQALEPEDPDTNYLERFLEAIYCVPDAVEPAPLKLRELSHIETLEVLAHKVRASIAEDDLLDTYWTTETEEADKAFWDYIEKHELQGALGADWEAGALKATVEELLTEAMDRLRKAL